MGTLPIEIWHSICAHLSRHELRVLRLVDRELNELCIPKIFHSLHLHRTSKSLEHCRSISETPHLAQCVSNLMLVEERLDISHTFHSFQNRIMAIWGPQDAADHLASKLVQDEQLYSEYMPALMREEWFDLDEDEQALSTLAGLLPNLVRISRCQAACTENLIEYREADRSLRDIYRLEWDIDREAFFLGNVVKLSSMQQVRSLELNPIQVREFARPFGLLDWEPWTEKWSLHNLTELKLVLVSHHRLPSTDSDDHVLECLARFFSACHNLHNLSISHIQPYHASRSTPNIQEISSLILQQQFPKLRSVQLRRLDCAETDLFSFAKNHADGLKFLTLRDIHLYMKLPRHHHTSALRLCWNLRNLLNLDHFCIGGEIETDSREIWRIATRTGGVADIRPERVTSSCVLTRLCDSVCKRIPFPFPPASMRDSGSEVNDEDIENVVELIHEVLPTEEIKERFSDDSFQWVGRPWPQADLDAFL